MLWEFFSNLLFAIIGRILCGNHLFKLIIIVHKHLFQEADSFWSFWETLTRFEEPIDFTSKKNIWAHCLAKETLLCLLSFKYFLHVQFLKLGNITWIFPSLTHTCRLVLKAYFWLSDLYFSWSKFNRLFQSPTSNDIIKVLQHLKFNHLITI